MLARPPCSTANRTTFLTNQAFASATTRISSASSTVILADSATATVQSSWTLAGKHYTGLFSLRWDKASAKWVLQDSLANVLSISTYASVAPVVAHPSFTLGAVAAPSGGAEYVVYPGVYPLVVNVPASSLDPALSNPPTSEQLTVVPFFAVPMSRINYSLAVLK